MKPYGYAGCRCWPDWDFDKHEYEEDPDAWMPNAHCPHHGLYADPPPPRSCDSVPADARWEVGCEPGQCIADGHQQLNKEKDGGLFTTIKRWIRDRGITGSTGPR